MSFPVGAWSLLSGGGQTVQLPGCWNPLGCQVMFAWISFNATFPRENTVDEANEWYSRWQTFKEIRGSRCRCKRVWWKLIGTTCFYVTWKLTISLTIWNWHVAGTTLFGISEYLFVFGWIFGKSFKMESIHGFSNNCPRSSGHNLYRYNVYIYYIYIRPAHDIWHPGKNGCTKNRHTKTTPKTSFGTSPNLLGGFFKQKLSALRTGLSFLRWQMGCLSSMVEKIHLP